MLKLLITMTWSLSLKLSLSIILTIALISLTLIIFQSRNIRVNRISILPYYAVIGLALYMIVYYSIFALFSIRFLPDPKLYSIWRAILSGPSRVFQTSITFTLMLYTDLLRELLAYQRRTNSIRINVLINEHFAKEKRMVLIYKAIYYISVPGLELVLLSYPIYILWTDPERFDNHHVAEALDGILIVRSSLVLFYYGFVLFRF